MLEILKQCYDIFRYLLTYFDWKTTLQIIYMSRVNINCWTIWREDDIQDEKTVFAFTPL